jgi:hypothetical protein
MGRTFPFLRGCRRLWPMVGLLSVPGLHLGGVRVLLNNGRHVLPEVAIALDNIVVYGLIAGAIRHATTR